MIPETVPASSLTTSTGSTGHHDTSAGPWLGPKGFTRVHNLWSDRALASLAVLWDWCAAEQDPTLRLALLFWGGAGTVGPLVDEPS
jgi:hypothetical protein